MDAYDDVVPVVLPNGSTAYVHARRAGGPARDVALDGPLRLDSLRDTIAGVAELARDAVSKVKPDSASVEFGIDVAVESGVLTGLLAKGSGSASLTVTLTWGTD